jgi:preprotein translocase subunit SecF
MTPTERVEVWRQRDGYWRWHYLTDSANGAVRFPSNREFASRFDAQASAETAYPGVPIEQVELVGQRLGRTFRRAVMTGVVVVTIIVVLRRLRPGER